jgi:hypothetical protein
MNQLVVKKIMVAMLIPRVLIFAGDDTPLIKDNDSCRMEILADDMEDKNEWSPVFMENNDLHALIVDDQREVRSDYSHSEKAITKCCSLPRYFCFGLVSVVRRCFYGKEIHLSSALPEAGEDQVS